MSYKNKAGYKSSDSLKDRLHEIIFEADTPSGKWFDIALLVFIFLSVLIVMLESVDSIDAKYHQLFFIIEWVLTIGFTIEYFLRIWVIKKPSKYIFSFFGIIDFLAIIPTYLSLFFVGTHYLLVIRALRLLRVFRVLKLAHFLSESQILIAALKASRTKIFVFIFTVIMLTCIIGSVMYLVEGPEHGFTSIPMSMYWSIVTMTTVGYGDIAPQTDFGKFLAALVMILGYGIIAVPTGIVTSELTKLKPVSLNTQACTNCGKEAHDDDADFCKYCGTKL